MKRKTKGGEVGNEEQRQEEQEEEDLQSLISPLACARAAVRTCVFVGLKETGHI